MKKPGAWGAEGGAVLFCTKYIMGFATLFRNVKFSGAIHPPNVGYAVGTPFSRCGMVWAIWFSFWLRLLQLRFRTGVPAVLNVRGGANSI